MKRTHITTALLLGGIFTAMAFGLYYISASSFLWPKPRTTDLSGRVTYKGKPLKMGFIIFMSVDCKRITAPIDADGTYSCIEVPVGEVRISIFCPEPEDPRKNLDHKIGNANIQRGLEQLVAQYEEAKKKWTSIPEDYEEFNKEKLMGVIKENQKTLDIDLQYPK
jgi:hypothetical protein